MFPQIDRNTISYASEFSRTPADFQKRFVVQKRLLVDNSSAIPDSGDQETLYENLYPRVPYQKEDFYERFLEVLEDDACDKIYDTFTKLKPENTTAVPPQRRLAISRADESSEKKMREELFDAVLIRGPPRDHEHLGILRGDKDSIHSSFPANVRDFVHNNVYSNRMRFERLRSQSDLEEVARSFDEVLMALEGKSSRPVPNSSETAKEFLDGRKEPHGSRALLAPRYESLSETRSRAGTEDESLFPERSNRMSLFWSISDDLQQERSDTYDIDEPLFSQSTIDSMNSLLCLPLSKRPDVRYANVSTLTGRHLPMFDPVTFLPEDNATCSGRDLMNKHEEDSFCREIRLELNRRKQTTIMSKDDLHSNSRADDDSYDLFYRRSHVPDADEGSEDELTEMKEYSAEIYDSHLRRGNKSFESEKSVSHFNRCYENLHVEEQLSGANNYNSLSCLNFCLSFRHDPSIRKGWNENYKRNLSSLDQTADHKQCSATSKRNFPGDKVQQETFAPGFQSPEFKTCYESDYSSTVSTVKSYPDDSCTDGSLEPLYDQVLSENLDSDVSFRWIKCDGARDSKSYAFYRDIHRDLQM